MNEVKKMSLIERVEYAISENEDEIASAVEILSESRYVLCPEVKRALFRQIFDAKDFICDLLEEQRQLVEKYGKCRICGCPLDSLDDEICPPCDEIITKTIDECDDDCEVIDDYEIMEDELCEDCNSTNCVCDDDDQK